MFERYTEAARRVIFFGRYEASEFGCEQIEADFLLLGIARENPDLSMQWLGANYAELRETIARLYTRDQPIATNVDLPLSSASKKALAYAGEEADRLRDRHIGTEHLFLGLLREGCTATKMLKAHHQDLKTVRKETSKDRLEMKASRLRLSRTGLQMKLVGEDGTEITVIPWQTQLPRIGESIRLPDKQGRETAYRVRDLCWRMHDAEWSGIWISEVLLTVEKEQL
jgi:ATP-dependent Clp protease ATP-binding subunit ClpC